MYGDIIKTRTKEQRKQRKEGNKMENKITEITIAINNQIAEAYEEYNKYGRTQWYFRNISRINGMIDVLKIITGKEYGFDESGLHERKAV